jgi:hypothetical protein
MAEAKTLLETSPVYPVDVDEIQLAQHPIIIERRGKPIAAVVSFDEYRRFSAWREERAARRSWVLERDPRRKMSAKEWHTHFEAMDHFAAHFDDVTPEELEAEITEAIATVRIEERATKDDRQ